MATTGPVVETVSRKRVVPASELENEKTSRVPDFWEYVESLRPEQWADHIVYLYRQEPKTTTFPGAPPAYLDKYVGTIEVRPGVTVAMDDAGTIQQAIKEKFGGRVFRLILKKGKERLTEGSFSTEAAPRYPDTTPNYAQHPLPNAGNTSDANAIASKAIDTVANQPQEVMNIAINALRASAELIAKSANPPAAAPATSTETDLDRALRQAMIAKLLAPPPDPVESFLRIKAALGDGGGSNGNMSTLMEKILGTLVEKGLNPAPVASGRTTLLDLGRAFIPVLGTTVRETMHEYRLSREADARIVELSRGMQSAQPMPSANPPALDVAPQPQPAAAPTPEPAAPAQALTFPQIEAHIAKIVKNVDYPVEEAVDCVLSFLYDTDPRIVGALLNPPTIDPRLKPGKEGLLQLFTYEPALQPCMVNTPRVSEFIDKFLVAAKEAEEAEARLRAAAPGVAPAPTAP